MSVAQGASMVKNAANIATLLFGIVMLMQLLLATGLLPITMAWGGRQARLTQGLRIASILSALILGLFAYIIRQRAGLTGAESSAAWINGLAWIVTATMAFNTVTNLMSQSTVEKIIFVPITAMLTIVSLIVSLSGR